MEKLKNERKERCIQQKSLSLNWILHALAASAGALRASAPGWRQIVETQPT